jgi:haloacetate dehalogenase
VETWRKPTSTDVFVQYGHAVGEAKRGGSFFGGFDLRRLVVGEVELRFRIGGSGPPVVLLHGHPQTHAMWHAVAPALAHSFTVVAPDLTGYGDSSKPETTSDHEPYSKRAMARDVVGLMDALGFARFRVAGHDRGGRVAYRLALDHPERVERLAVLDIVPTAEMWRRADKEFGLVDWHWFFLAQPAPFPETMIGAAPAAFYFRGDRSRFHPEALADYLRAVEDVQTVHAMCEDYRAGAAIDHELDDADLAAGHRIECPLLVLWAGRDELGDWFDVLATWRRWASSVRGRALDCGHFIAEENPEETARELIAFFSDDAGLGATS